MSKKLTVEARVAKGVKWLDKHGPEDWRNKVEIKNLDLQSTCRCVLGQVFAEQAADEPLDVYEYPIRSGFDWVLDRFRDKRGSIRVVEHPALYGFDAYDDGCWGNERWDSIDKDYAALKQEWTRVLAA